MVNSINTNTAAYFAQANIGIASNLASASVARLSSGNRIVRASDDVAALSIGTSLRTSVSTLKIARQNAAQGATLLQIADGALSQTTEILQRQKALAIQAGSGSLSATDRGFLDQEFQALTAELDRLASGTNFNGVNLIDGSLAGANPLQSAANGTAVVGGFDAIGTAVTAVALTDGAGSVGDTTFIGDLSQGVWSVTSAASTGYAITFSINGSTYAGFIADIGATGTTVALTNGEGDIDLTLAADLTAADATFTEDAAGATAFQEALTEAFSGATAFANRTVLATDAAGAAGSAIEAADTNGTTLEGFTGAGVTLRSQYYSGDNLPTISDFRVVGTFGVGTKLEVTIDGRTYRSAANTTATGIDAGDGFGDGNGVIDFFLDGDETTNANEYLKLTLTSVEGDVDIDTQEGMNGFINALNGVFGRSGGGLSFQVGANSSDSLQVLVASATTAALYEGATLDVLTQETAETASDALTVALNAVSAIRAGVGAAQSRFNFAQANIDVAVQNQDAARAELLETDIALESTVYATAQVKLQAGISVLAQANQQLQSLLKLIG
jgi:flagellin